MQIEWGGSYASVVIVFTSEIDNNKILLSSFYTKVFVYYNNNKMLMHVCVCVLSLKHIKCVQ